MKTVTFLLLSLATLGCVTFITQYYETGPQILLNANFSSDLEHWQLRKKGENTVIVQDGGLAIHSTDTNTAVSLSQTITNRFRGKKLQVKALLRNNNIVSGVKPYDRQRLLLIQYFGDKADFTLPHQVKTRDGTNDWQMVNEAFTISEDCTKLKIVVKMRHCSGDFYLKDLSVHPVIETSIYTTLKWLLRGAWIIFSFFIFIPYLGNQRLVISKILLLFTVAAILIGTTMPAKEKNHLKKQIKSHLTILHNKDIVVHPTMVANTSSKWQQFINKKLKITKIAHFILFSLLIIMLRRNNPSRPVRLLLLDILMLACATELSQFFIEYRSPLFTDLIIDMAGGGSGFFLASKN